MWHLESTDFYDKINPFQSISFRLFHPIHVFTDANMHVRMCVCAQTHTHFHDTVAESIPTQWTSVTNTETLAHVHYPCPELLYS